MIRTFRIQNFKSIADLTVELGRVTVLIGSNGSGKSNLLEAIAFASAAVQFKMENEFLSTRGIRVTDPQFMKSAFVESQDNPEHEASGGHADAKISGGRKKSIELFVQGDNSFEYRTELSEDDSTSYPRWRQSYRISGEHKTLLKAMYLDIKRQLSRPGSSDSTHDPTQEDLGNLVEFQRQIALAAAEIVPFLIFAPENSALRTFQSEGQILPLGIRGEGLFAHLKALSAEKFQHYLDKIKEHLSLMDWFESFEIPSDLGYGERSLRIRDRFLQEGLLFDQRSANEGFLFLLFYLTLMISPDTPKFFAIDNVETALNPKLCVALVQQIVQLAKENGKQVLLTTHNPAILDGLDLNDDEQRLLVVDRNAEGHTSVRRVEAPKVRPGQVPVSLSEAFLRGYIGGLPKNF